MAFVTCRRRKPSAMGGDKDYSFIPHYPPLYDNNIFQSKYLATRMGAWTQTPNDAPCKILNTGEIVGYAIPIPQDAIGVTVNTPDYYTGLAMYNVIDGKVTLIYQGGWSPTLSTNTITFEASKGKYLGVNVKHRQNVGIADNVDTSEWTIDFIYAPSTT